MMRAGFFLAAGAAAGVYGSLKARRLADEFTSQGLHHRLKALALGARLFREEVAQGQAEATLALRERYGLDQHRALPGPQRGAADTADTAGTDATTPIATQEGTD